MVLMPSEGVKAKQEPELLGAGAGSQRGEGPHEEHKNGSTGPQTRAGEGTALGQALPSKRSELIILSLSKEMPVFL